MNAAHIRADGLRTGMRSLSLAHAFRSDGVQEQNFIWSLDWKIPGGENAGTFPHSPGSQRRNDKQALKVTLKINK